MRPWPPVLTKFRHRRSQSTRIRKAISIYGLGGELPVFVRIPADPLHHPGSCGPAAGAAHIRRRLAHTRRQRRARLHLRDGPGRRPRGRLAPPAGATAATADAQPRPRLRHLGAGTGACFRAGQRPQPALHDGRSPPRRHRPASPPPAGPTPPGAAEVLGWRTQRDLDAMCRDAWCWQQANPDGYGG